MPQKDLTIQVKVQLRVLIKKKNLIINNSDTYYVTTYIILQAVRDSLEIIVLNGHLRRRGFKTTPAQKVVSRF